MIMQQKTNRSSNNNSMSSKNHHYQHQYNTNNMYSIITHSSTTPSKKPSSNRINSSLHNNEFSTIHSNPIVHSKNNHQVYNHHAKVYKTIEESFDNIKKGIVNNSNSNNNSNNNNNHDNDNDGDEEEEEKDEEDTDDNEEEEDDEGYYWSFIYKMKQKKNRQRSISVSSTSSFDISGSDLSSMDSISSLSDNDIDEEEEKMNDLTSDDGNDDGEDDDDDSDYDDSKVSDFKKKNHNSTTKSIRYPRRNNHCNKKDKISSLPRVTTAGNMDQAKASMVDEINADFRNNAARIPLYDDTMIANDLRDSETSVGTKSLGDDDMPLHVTENQQLKVVQPLLKHGIHPFMLNTNNVSPTMPAMNLSNNHNHNNDNDNDNKNKEMMILFDPFHSFNGPSKTPFVQPSPTLKTKQPSSSFTTKDTCQLNSTINNTTFTVCTSKKRCRLVSATEFLTPSLTVTTNRDESEKKRIKNAALPRETMETQEDQRQDDFKSETQLKIEPVEDPLILIPTLPTILTSSSSSHSLPSSHIHPLRPPFCYHESRTPIPTPPPESWQDEKKSLYPTIIKEEENEVLRSFQPSSHSLLFPSYLLQPTLTTIQSYFPLYMTTLNDDTLWVIDYQLYLLLGGERLIEDGYFMNPPWEKYKRLMTLAEKQQCWPYLEKKILFHYQHIQHERKEITLIQQHFLSHSFYFIPLDQAIASFKDYHHHDLLKSKLSTQWIDIKYTPTLPLKMAMKLKKLNRFY
ncbi:unnamed protein product [Cunninghamella blakesleeana]